MEGYAESRTEVASRRWHKNSPVSYESLLKEDVVRSQGQVAVGAGTWHAGSTFHEDGGNSTVTSLAHCSDWAPLNSSKMWG